MTKMKKEIVYDSHSTLFWETAPGNTQRQHGRGSVHQLRFYAHGGPEYSFVFGKGRCQRLWLTSFRQKRRTVWSTIQYCSSTGPRSSSCLRGRKHRAPLTIPSLYIFSSREFFTQTQINKKKIKRIKYTINQSPLKMLFLLRRKSFLPEIS